MRDGVRFACAGDGLCCADAHLIGPVSPRERAGIERIRPGSTARHERGLVVIRTREDGTCTFLARAARCAIHRDAARPRTCHRYPFMLVSTPDGGRIATDHRCPCRTMGARPLLRPEDAEDALRDAAGRLSVDRRIDARIPIAKGRAIAWSTWKEREAELLDRLARGERPEIVLEAEPFPAVRDGSWPQIGFDLADDDRATRWTRASQWAGDAILALHGETARADRPRPWRDAFDRAERRTNAGTIDPEAMIADWIADSIWSIEWAFHGTWERARADLATRLAITRWIAARLEALGARRDRAAAEAIAIAEIVGLSDPWAAVLARGPA